MGSWATLRSTGRQYHPLSRQAGDPPRGRGGQPHSPCTAANRFCESDESGQSLPSLQWSLDLGGCIGEGGFGRVHLGSWHKAPVAIKARAGRRSFAPLAGQLLVRPTLPAPSDRPPSPLPRAPQVMPAREHDSTSGEPHLAPRITPWPHGHYPGPQGGSALWERPMSRFCLPESGSDPRPPRRPHPALRLLITRTRLSPRPPPIQPALPWRWLCCPWWRTPTWSDCWTA